MMNCLLPGETLSAVTSSGEGCLRGHYRELGRPAFFKVEGDSVTYHEGGREKEYELRFERGVFRPAPPAMREVTGIQNYNFKIIRVGKVQYFLLVFSILCQISLFY